ncbi:MAG: DUF2505 domain-containing protein [Microthrixaceae bacterium]
MEITRTHTFDAPAEQCWAMFSDPASHTNKFERMGHIGVEVVEKKKTKKQLRIVITREVEVDGIPGFAKKFIKPRNTMVSTDEWNDLGDGTYGGTFVLDTKGVPVQISGRTRLEPKGQQTEYTIVLDIKVNVPLVGGKLADFSKGIALRQLDEEFAIGDEWLAAH